MEIYAIIGFIINYGGGIDLQNRIVQRFSVKELDEDSVIEKFEKTCHSYFKENNQTSDLEIIEAKEIKIFKSEKICSEIRKKCQLDSFLGRDYFSLNECIFETVPISNYYNRNAIGNQQRLAFLNAALSRHKLGNKYYFYNDYEKAILVHRILSRFADEEDEIKMMSTFQTPWTISIEIKRGENIWKKD